MRSKALVRFLNRAARFSDDLELVSVVGLAIERGVLTPDTGVPLFTQLDDELHPRLAKAKPTQHNRELVFAHLRKTVYASYIKDLYEDFVDYLGEVVSSAARKGLAPESLRGDYKVQLSAADLLECGSLDGVRGAIIEALHQRLAALGTVKTITFLDRRLGLALDPAIVEPALAFLDLRHLLVHSDGIADTGFCDRHPEWCARAGEPVRLDETVTRDALTAIAALVEHVDGRAVETGILPSQDLQ
jgi:hypothetical protein